MLKHRHIDRIVLGFMALAVLVTVLFSQGEALGLRPADATPGYVDRLFDDSRVHTIDIRMENWDGFIAASAAKEYVPVTLAIDGEEYHNVGLRTKGNSSLRVTNKYDYWRHSFKVEFDHYVRGQYYHGLDKFSLDCSFQDNSYMKSTLTYELMHYMQVPASLTSYVWITVNGADWGLYIAIEEPEEAYARRNWGRRHGQLYKPGYRSLHDENADVQLRYVDEDPESYDNIFRNARFKTSRADRQRVIDALRVLASGENLASAIDVDTVLRYFVAQVFVVNLDSYLGPTAHNYFLYEEDGILTILPWDYNLAFATYSLGMPNPVNDACLYVNYPINTPASGEVMRKRPLYHNVMKNQDYFRQYRAYFDELISNFFESGLFEAWFDMTAARIAPYVERDPTAYRSYRHHQLAVATLREFCLLRAASIRGQLDGTIPATIRGQAADGSALIDASGIWLPDMGHVSDFHFGRDSDERFENGGLDTAPAGP